MLKSLLARVLLDTVVVARFPRPPMGVMSRNFFSPPPPPPLAFNLAGLPLEDDFQTEEDAEEEDASKLNMAVPKRRVSHRRKRIKFFPKNLKRIESFATCAKCGEMHPSHYQLCPFCQPFNNFLRTKDHPAKAEDRLRREYELKKQEQILLQRAEDKKAQVLATGLDSQDAATAASSKKKD